MENPLTQYNQGLAGNQSRDQGVLKFIFFRYAISGSAVKLPSTRRGFPETKSHLYCFPCTRPQGGLTGNLPVKSVRGLHHSIRKNAPRPLPSCPRPAHRLRSPSSSFPYLRYGEVGMRAFTAIRRYPKLECVI
jgi:hypothetical protein